MQSGLQQAQQLVQAHHQFNIQQAQGQEDYNTQVARSDQQFYLATVARPGAIDIQTARSKEDFNTQMLQSQQAYQRSVDRSTRDFVYQEQLYVKSVAESIDPWAQVQARSVTDANMALQNIQQQNKMLAPGRSAARRTTQAWA